MSLNSDFLKGLTKLRPSSTKRKRISSYDKTFQNMDFINLKKKEKRVFAEISGSGCIKHIWVTMSSSDKEFLRKVILRIYWDDEENPSVEVPIGDFFGIGHAISKDYWSLPLSMSPADGKGFNCWWQMPFASKARFEIENETRRALIFYFYIDYEEYENGLEERLGRFHASWHRKNPCEGISDENMSYLDFNLKGKNTDFSKNYLILETEGKGHYVGCNLNIHNLRITDGENWPGEGDEMIFIDEDPQLTIYGTGTEDYFSTAFCPSTEFSTPFYGITLGGGKEHSGKISYYRYHIPDPIYFEKSIKVTIEHGHANRRYDDYSSTAYWYQTEPHKKFEPLLPVKERLPRKEPKEIPWD